MITNAVINISSDIMIIILPMPVFLQSQLPLKRKIILCGVFALGIFTVSSHPLTSSCHCDVKLTWPSDTGSNHE